MASGLFTQYLVDRWVNLNEADLLDFERLLGTPLPKDYRDFIKTNNGGVVLDAITYYFPFDQRPTADWPEGGSTAAIRELYSLQLPTTVFHRNLTQQIEIHHGRIPDNSIPIGDADSNLILLDLKTGEVLYWVRDNELRVNHPNENSELVASSFGDYTTGYSVVPFAIRRDLAMIEEEPFVSIHAYDHTGFLEWINDNRDWLSDSSNKRSCFDEACRARDLSLASDLLDSGVDASIDDLFKSAVEFAAWDIMLLLLERGAKEEGAEELLLDGFHDECVAVIEYWKAGRLTFGGRRGWRG